MPTTHMLQRIVVVQTKTDEPHQYKPLPHWNLKVESKHHNTNRRMLVGGLTLEEKKTSVKDP